MEIRRSISDKEEKKPETSVINDDDQTYVAVIYMDNDGPIHDMSKNSESTTHYGADNENKESSYNITNKEYLSTVFKFLAANRVLIVPGSQRLTWTDELKNKAIELQKQTGSEITDENRGAFDRLLKKNEDFKTDVLNMKDSIFRKKLDEFISEQDRFLKEKDILPKEYDAHFGKDRNYLRMEDAITVLDSKASETSRNADVELKGINEKRKPTKAPYMKHIHKIKGAEHFDQNPKKIYHVDDFLNLKETTEEAGFSFILASRTPKQKSYFSYEDNQYLAQMLAIVINKDQIKNSDKDDWTRTMLAISQASLEKFSNHTVAQKLRDLMKVDYALQELYKQYNRIYKNEELTDDLKSYELQRAFLEQFSKLKEEIKVSNPILLFDFINNAINPPNHLVDGKKITASIVSDNLYRFIEYTVGKCINKTPIDCINEALTTTSKSIKDINQQISTNASSRIFAGFNKEMADYDKQMKALTARQSYYMVEKNYMTKLQTDPEKYKNEIIELMQSWGKTNLEIEEVFKRDRDQIAQNIDEITQELENIDSEIAKLEKYRPEKSTEGLKELAKVEEILKEQNKAAVKQLGTLKQPLLLAATAKATLHASGKKLEENQKNTKNYLLTEIKKSPDLNGIVELGVIVTSNPDFNTLKLRQGANFFKDSVNYTKIYAEVVAAFQNEIVARIKMMNPTSFETKMLISKIFTNDTPEYKIMNEHIQSAFLLGGASKNDNELSPAVKELLSYTKENKIVLPLSGKDRNQFQLNAWEYHANLPSIKPKR